MRDSVKLVVGALAALSLISTPAMADATRAVNSPAANAPVAELAMVAPTTGIRDASEVANGSALQPAQQTTRVSRGAKVGQTKRVVLGGGRFALYTLVAVAGGIGIWKLTEASSR
jgi:hypothetical protein